MYGSIILDKKIYNALKSVYVDSEFEFASCSPPLHAGCKVQYSQLIYHFRVKLTSQYVEISPDHA